MTDDTARLEARIGTLEKERRQLLATVGILQEISASLHFVDILQAVARRLGETFGLDRCSVFLANDAAEARLVASYEDPSIRNLVVDLERYPELKRAFESGDTVFIPDAGSDPALASVKGELERRGVQSIVVLPIQWEQRSIGAIFLRSLKGQPPISDDDIRFVRLVAQVTASALWNAHRFDQATRRGSAEPGRAVVAAEAERAALLTFVHRLLDRHAAHDVARTGAGARSRASTDELDRLVDVALRVIGEEGHG